MKPIAEATAACAIVAIVTAIAFALQSPRGVVLWDAGQYYKVSNQFASNQRPFAEVPYVYRVGVPWLVSRISPQDALRGFERVNLVSAFAIALLLDVWLARWVRSRDIRLAMVALFAIAWHGPVRYLYFNPGYVDPPFIAFAILSLVLIDALARRYSTATLALLTATTIAGTLVRETMAIPAIAFLFVNNPVRRRLLARQPDARVPGIAVWVPLIASAAVIAWTHSIVTVDTAERSFVGAVLQWMHKAPWSYTLAWFTGFGPILALVVFDWRRAWRDVAGHEWIVVYFVVCAALAFIGGSDTERFVFWTLPVVYLLVGRAIERHRVLLSDVALSGALLVSQVISARLFWGIPDPVVDGPALSGLSWVGRVYGVIDRLIVVDHFHWNLWSSFGSRPFQFVRLGLYLLVTAVLVRALHVRAARMAAGSELLTPTLSET